MPIVLPQKLKTTKATSWRVAPKMENMLLVWRLFHFLSARKKAVQTFYTKKHIEETYKLKLKLKLEQNVLISGKFFR